MLRITLSAGEQAAREQTLKTTAERQLRDRCQAVLMAHRGRNRKAIAGDLGVHRTTVKKWLEQYRARGVEGLRVQRAPGKPRRLDDLEVVYLWADGLYVKAGLEDTKSNHRTFVHSSGKL